jgi:hypothetical protein
MSFSRRHSDTAGTLLRGAWANEGQIANPQEASNPENMIGERPIAGLQRLTTAWR